MKFLCSIAFFCSTFSLNYCVANAQFSYTYEQKERKPFNLDLYEVQKIFEDQGFIRFGNLPEGDLPYIYADEVFYSQGNPQKIILVKTNLIAPADMRYKIIADKNFYMFHTDKISMAFFNFTSNEINNSLKEFPGKKSWDEKIVNFFIPNAVAEVDSNCQPQKKSNLFQLEKINDNLNETLLVRKISECAMKALKGAGEEIKAAAEFFTKLKNDPGTLWKEMKKNFLEIQKFVMDLKNELQTLYANVSTLTGEEKLEMACLLSGQMGASIALSMTGAGFIGGSSRIVMEMIPKIKRLDRMLTHLKTKRLSSEVAKDSLNCAI